MKVLKRLDLFIEQFATKVLVACVLSMLTFSVLTIVLRWFNAHVMWIEPMVRYLVVISAFLGGTIATGRGSHIAIDVIGKYLESQDKTKAHLNVKRVTDLISLIALIFLTYACIGFVEQEAEYGKIVFLKLHAKYLAMILPIGFALMGFRFFIHFIYSFGDSVEGES